MSNPKDHFDPADLETEELLPSEAPTSHDDINDDTMADPEGAAARANPGKQFPERVHRDYLIKNGTVNVSTATVEACMAIFDTKKDTDVAFEGGSLETYKTNVEAIIEGKKPLLEVDAPTSGYNMLSEMTRTWAEFICAIYDYTSWARQLNPDLDQPQSFIDLETKMHNLGIKARLLRDASSELWIFFNINGTFSLDKVRVERAVFGRFERLADYYNNRYTESTAGREMKKASAESATLIVDIV